MDNHFINNELDLWGNFDESLPRQVFINEHLARDLDKLVCKSANLSEIREGLNDMALSVKERRDANNYIEEVWGYDIG